MQHMRSINNTDANVAEKMNYFIDVFNHYVSYAGTEYSLELETPLSLLEKIVLQLEDNHGHNIVYLENYLANELFDHPGFWDRYPEYAGIEQHIIEFKSANSKKEKQSIADRASFQTALKRMITVMVHKLPKQRVDSLLSVIKCPQTLREHEHTAKLSTIARMMVADGFFTGKSGREIQDTINSVFNKKTDRFPFPVGAKKTNKRKIIENRNLDDQLLGFMSLMEDNAEKDNVLMKAYCTFKVPDSFIFEYNGVEFHGHQNTKISKLKEYLKDDEFYGFFLEGGNYILVSARISWFDYKNIPREFKKAVQSQVDYVTYMLNTHLTLDDSPNFLIVNRNWTMKYGMLSTQKHGLDFQVRRLDDLDDNPYRILGKIRNSPGKEWLLSHEPLLIAAYRQESVSLCWQYLEAILPKDLKGNPQVKAIVSDIILLNEKRVQQHRILDTFYKTIDFFNYEGLGLKYEELAEIHRLLGKGKISNVLRKLDYPFAKELIADFDLSFDKAYFRKARDYYYRMLTEAYEIRNFDVHSGTTPNKAFIKINQVLPKIITRLRWMLFDEIKANPQLAFELIVESLKEKGRKLYTLEAYS